MIAGAVIITLVKGDAKPERKEQTKNWWMR